VATLVIAPEVDNSGLLPHGFLLGLVGILDVDPFAALTHETVYALATTALAFSSQVADLQDTIEGLRIELDDAEMDILAFGDEVKP
jgi:hypothetical protein